MANTNRQPLCCQKIYSSSMRSSPPMPFLGSQRSQTRSRSLCRRLFSECSPISLDRICSPSLFSTFPHSTRIKNKHTSYNQNKFFFQLKKLDGKIYFEAQISYDYFGQRDLKLGARRSLFVCDAAAAAFAAVFVVAIIVFSIEFFVERLFRFVSKISPGSTTTSTTSSASTFVKFSHSIFNYLFSIIFYLKKIFSFKLSFFIKKKYNQKIRCVYRLDFYYFNMQKKKK